MRYRPLFNSKKREALWQREQLAAWVAGFGAVPRCNLCGEPVRADQAWHESHHPDQPRVFGGRSVGIAHAGCNLCHAAEVVTPAVARCDRIARKHAGTWRRSKWPLPGGRGDARKRKINGTVIDRATGERWARRG